MPLIRKFRIQFEGTNYWLEMDNTPERLGFYTSFLVEGADAEAAELEARRMLQTRLSPYRVLNAAEDPPSVRVDCKEEFNSFTGVTAPEGFTFFPDDGT
jgi:hypothetical protein